MSVLEALACPACGASPRLGTTECPGCGRPDRTPGGAIDLLPDSQRAEADAYSVAYEDIRRREGWAPPDGREGPGKRPSGLWKRRVAGVRTVARLVRGSRRILDVGAGGGWLAGHLGDAEVVALDLREIPAGGPAAVRVRADMRTLPVRDGSFDAVVYAAALHHAPLGKTLAEGARVIRRGGVLAIVDSPIYPGPEAAARALDRVSAYLDGMGAANLSPSYLPIDALELRHNLEAAGLEVLRFDSPSRGRRVVSILRGRSGMPVVMARRR